MYLSPFLKSSPLNCFLPEVSCSECLAPWSYSMVSHLSICYYVPLGDILGSTGRSYSSPLKTTSLACRRMFFKWVESHCSRALLPIAAGRRGGEEGLDPSRAGCIVRPHVTPGLNSVSSFILFSKEYWLYSYCLFYSVL